MVEFRMPKLGESIAEATVISWLKNVGDYIAAEETLLEVATDKVDSEVPSPVSGIIKEIRFQKNDVVPVGTVMALIEASEGESQSQSSVSSLPADQGRSQSQMQQSTQVAEPSSPYASAAPSSVAQLRQGGTTFLSPLIISIAQKENLSIEELQLIPGSGADGRLQKSDVYQYLKNRKYPVQSKPVVQSPPTSSYPKPKINFTEGKDYIIEMDRMRKMISDHMVYSKQT
ncbi:biotin/lipoyl-containing protein, partial [Flavobacterium sp.]